MLSGWLTRTAVVFCRNVTRPSGESQESGWRESSIFRTGARGFLPHFAVQSIKDNPIGESLIRVLSFVFFGQSIVFLQYFL